MKKFTISFTLEQLKAVNDALMELKYRISAPLINHINAEIQKQFDDAVDDKDMPTGQTKPKDEFAGD